MRKKYLRNSDKLYLLGCCVLWLVFGTGCKQVLPVKPASMPEKAVYHQLEQAFGDVEQAYGDLEQAYGDFENQQYEHALTLFDKIARTHKTGFLNRYARYGIAAVHLATAQTAAEMEDAMTDWVYWFQQMPEKYHHEDPRLLDQVLHNYRVYLNKDVQRTKKWHIERKWFQSELKKKQAQIDELQRKIEAIETIHQDIQEKKRQITPPATEDALGNS